MGQSWFGRLLDFVEAKRKTRDALRSPRVAQAWRVIRADARLWSEIRRATWWIDETKEGDPQQPPDVWTARELEGAALPDAPWCFVRVMNHDRGRTAVEGLFAGRSFVFLVAFLPGAAPKVIHSRSNEWISTQRL